MALLDMADWELSLLTSTGLGPLIKEHNELLEAETFVNKCWADNT